MSERPEFIVLRGGPLDGRWIPNMAGIAAVDVGGLIYNITDRFETNDDGAQAQVYEASE